MKKIVMSAMLGLGLITTTAKPIDLGKALKLPGTLAQILLNTQSITIQGLITIGQIEATLNDFTKNEKVYVTKILKIKDPEKRSEEEIKYVINKMKKFFPMLQNVNEISDSIRDIIDLFINDIVLAFASGDKAKKVKEFANKADKVYQRIKKEIVGVQKPLMKVLDAAEKEMRKKPKKGKGKAKAAAKAA